MRLIEYDNALKPPAILVQKERSIFLMLFLPVWLTGWAVGEFFALRELLVVGDSKTPKSFLTIWLVGWTIGGLLAGVSWLWNTFGDEKVFIQSDLLTCDKGVGRFRRKQSVNINDIIEVRFSPPVVKPMSFSSNLQQWGIGNGSIVITTTNIQVIRFGRALEEIETQPIIDEIRRQLAALKPGSGS